MIRRACVLATVVLFWSAPAFAGGSGHGHGAPAIARSHGSALDHSRSHGTPSGWQFQFPKGKPALGREVFVKFDCYSCHKVSGEIFPDGARADKGPDLAGMGPMHPAEYFAQSIIEPNAIVDPPYADLDGSSPMPSFNEDLTVQELIDLVAYLKSLIGPATTRHH